MRMSDEVDSLPLLNDREKTLVLIIRHSLSASLKPFMLESTCKSIHETLKEDREERGKELTEMKNETKEWREKMEGKLGKMYWFIVTTLVTSLAALFIKVLDKVPK